MSIRPLAALAFVTVVLARQLACTPPNICPNGFLPFDGQTGVPLDAAIVVETGAQLPGDLPPLDDALVLTLQGEVVPVDYDVDAGSGRIVMTPRAPLDPDVEYEVSGIDWDILRGSGTHWWGPAGRDWAQIRFRTASEPALIGVFLEAERRLGLVFSEAMDLASLEGAVRIKASGAEWTEATVVGSDGDHLVIVESDATTVATAGIVELDGALAASGAELRTRTTQLVWTTPDSAEASRIEGQPYCF